MDGVLISKVDFLGCNECSQEYLQSHSMTMLFVFYEI